jgi:hypothetical protein
LAIESLHPKQKHTTISFRITLRCPIYLCGVSRPDATSSLGVFPSCFQPISVESVSRPDAALAFGVVYLLWRSKMTHHGFDFVGVLSISVGVSRQNTAVDFGVLQFISMKSLTPTRFVPSASSHLSLWSLSTRRGFFSRCLPLLLLTYFGGVSLTTRRGFGLRRCLLIMAK